MQQILQEVYYGKILRVQQIEDTLNLLRKTYAYEGIHNPLYIIQKINKDELLTKMSNYIKEQWGFGEVIITITNDKALKAGTIGFLATKEGIAFTDDFIKRVELNKAIVMTLEGPRFDSKQFSPNILIMLSSGLLFSTFITVEEIMAAFLHEIGHSFSKGVLGSRDFDDMVDEKYADSFCIMYGYGAELNSVLTKITTYRRVESSSILRKIPVVNVFVGLKDILNSFIAREVIGDVHPSIDTRMKDSIAQMEYDLNQADNLSPKQKEVLSKNLDRAKLIYNKYYKNTPYMSDTIFKAYSSKIEPNLYRQSKAEERAQRSISPTIINQAYDELNNVDKGYFKAYPVKKQRELKRHG